MLHAVLLDSFQDSDPQVFKTHSILKLDQAALARHSDCVGDENAADKRIPYASNMYVALKTKYDTHSNTDCLKTVMANDVARSSFNPQALVAWTAMLWNRWSDLVNMQESFNAEYVAVLELLLAMKNQTYSPDWSKWARNYSMVKTEAKDFKVRKFLDNAVLAEKIEVLSKQHSQNKHKQAQTHLGHGCEKKSFKGGDNSGGGGSSNKHITCPCGAKFVPHMPSHGVCTFDRRKASRNSAGSDLDRASQLLGSRSAGQQLLDKACAKDKKKWGKKKAGAHHASAKINFDDLSSASDASLLTFRTQLMSLTLLLPLLLMSSVARVVTSANDPSASLEVYQLISHMCQNMRSYLVLARLLLECINQLK